MSSRLFQVSASQFEFLLYTYTLSLRRIADFNSPYLFSEELGEGEIKSSLAIIPRGALASKSE